MGEHKRKKTRLKISVLRGTRNGLFSLAGLCVVFGLYAAIDTNEGIHRILQLAIAEGHPGWVSGFVPLMTFGVYGCCTYLFFGLARLIQFRLSGHHINEVIEGKSWD